MIDDLRLRRDDVGGLYRREFKNQRFQMIADSQKSVASEKYRSQVNELYRLTVRKNANPVIDLLARVIKLRSPRQE
jgi:hypothetical protein